MPKKRGGNRGRAKYKRHMEEIKKRTEVVYAFLNKRRDALYGITTVESMYLQIRRILELIALSSLAAHKSEYNLQQKKFRKLWHPDKIFSSLGEINPRFYPSPAKPSDRQETGLDWEPIESGFLTKQELSKLYGLCGGVLHGDTPFSTKRNIQPIFEDIHCWMQKIMRLLNFHMISLARDQQWLLAVSMETEDEGKVQIAEFHRIDEKDMDLTTFQIWQSKKGLGRNPIN